MKWKMEVAITRPCRRNASVFEDIALETTQNTIEREKERKK